MSEQQADYVTEAQEAIEMPGAGYEPTLEIEAPRTVTERRGGKLVDSWRSAFVKIYTDFKSELKTIKGDDLKVWLYLALSVNRYSGTAHPGLRRIAEDTDLAVNTVRACLERLEETGLLDIEKADGKGNTYRPSDYVSVSKTTVSKFDTVPSTVSKSEPTVSKSEPTVSKNGGTVSNQYRKSAQLEELEELELTRKDILDGILEMQLKPKAIQDSIKDNFKLTPNWTMKTNRQFMEWAVSENILPEQIKLAARVWGSDKRFNWAQPNLKGIQEHWLQLLDIAAPAEDNFMDELAAKRARLEAQVQR